MMINKLNKSDTIILFFYIFFVSFIFYFTNKGLLFSDGAFYAFHLVKPNLETIDVSNWHHIYRIFCAGNFIVNLKINLLLILTSSAFLGFTFLRYFKLHFISRFDFLFFSICQFILFSPVGFDPSYYWLNVIIINLSTGLLFLYLNIEKKLILYLIGFFLGFIPFVQITSSLILILFALIIYIQNKTLRTLGVLFLGICSAWVLFFLFAVPISDFYESLRIVLEYLSQNNEGTNHGFQPMLFWFKSIFMELGLPFTISVLIYLRKQIALSKAIIALLILLYAGLIILELHKSLLNPTYLFGTKPIYFIILITLIVFLKEFNQKKIQLLLFLFFIPVFINLGTNVPFFNRAALYAPILLCILIIQLNTINLSYKHLKKIYLSIFLFSLLNFFSYPFRGCWEEYIPSKQTFPIFYNNSKIYLDKNRFEELKIIKKQIKDRQHVIAFAPKLWGYVLLSNAKPDFVYFTPNDWVLNRINEIKNNSLTLLTYSDQHELVRNKIAQLTNYNLTRRMKLNNRIILIEMKLKSLK